MGSIATDLSSDDAKLIATLQRGVATPEHAAFVATLRSQVRKQAP